MTSDQSARGRRPERSLGAAALCCAMILAGCATPFTTPPSVADSAIRARATTVEDEGITVSAALPDRNEVEAVFGLDLAADDIQPLWLEIRNDTDEPMMYLPTSTDPEYFSANEMAFSYRKQYSQDSYEAFSGHIQSLMIQPRLRPRSTTSGYVLTRKDLGSKFVSVDVIGDSAAKNFNFMVKNPENVAGSMSDSRVLDLLEGIEVTNVDTATMLRQILEQLPCCTSDRNGEPGLPLNIVLIGSRPEIYSGATARRFHFQDVETQYLFGRKQDISGVKEPSWVRSQPHILRMWLTDYRYLGKRVWVGQISMPQGGRFAGLLAGDNDVLNDPDIDEARNDFLQDMIYSQHVDSIGFVTGVGSANRQEPRRAFNGSDYYTDGLRAVMIFGPGNTTLSQVDNLGWERLSKLRLEQR